MADLTIDQLAAAVNMTVRNVRAYAARGLIEAPRLVGRTGYYGAEHVSRLKLVRDLLDRGYTLSAVERALARDSFLPSGQALDLLDTLSDPRGPEEPEEMDLETLAGLTTVDPDPDFIDQLAELGLLERIDETRVRLLKPFIVRAGAQALALGLARPTVLALLPFLSEQLSSVARRFVDDVRREVWRPLSSKGYPEEEWPAMLNHIEGILPVASQAVVAVFREQLNLAIDEALGEELGEASGEFGIGVG